MLTKALQQLDGATILVTGGTGSFGKCFTKYLLENSNVQRIRILSRGELKQHLFRAELEEAYPDKADRVRFLIGDIRDKDRLYRAFVGVDYIFHAAAMKQVPACEYDPFEAVKTNVIGAQNIIDVAIDNKVKKVLFLSTDKACSPANAYGKTKALAESLFVAGNNYSPKENRTILACTRYGNVIGSRGSVIPLFRKQAETGVLTITDTNMTRFWLTLTQGVEFVITSMMMAKGGEIFVPIIPSMKITDLALAIAPAADWKEIGIRSGEKLHEMMMNEDEARHAIRLHDRYVIIPEYHDWTQHLLYAEGIPIDNGFTYASNTNDHWLTAEALRQLDDISN